MFDWDDLRIFAAAARAGSLAGAAQRVGRDATTVGRRIHRLEAALKATLFTRSRQGFQLTATGRRLLELAQDIEAAVEGARHLQEARSIDGVVRISLSEGFGSVVVAPAVPALVANHPRLSLELIASPGFLSPSRREADMVVTLSPPDTARLVTERLADYELGLYAAPSFLTRFGRPERVEELTAFPIIGYIDDLIYAPELRYLPEIGPHLQPILSSTSIRAQEEMIAAGGGIGVLPCFLAGGLTRVLPSVRLIRTFWMSTYREIAETARMRVIRAWMHAIVRQERWRLRPEDPLAVTPLAAAPVVPNGAAR